MQTERRVRVQEILDPIKHKSLRKLSPQKNKSQSQRQRTILHARRASAVADKKTADELAVDHPSQ